MKPIISSLFKDKSRTLPILSFPSTQLLGISVNELITSSDYQAAGMKAIADRCKIGASLNMMDLSVEAEAFGAQIKFSDDEVPTVSRGIIDSIAAAGDITVPEIGKNRTAIYIEGVKKAKELITDIPVFCGVIGPYSLAGRLYDMTELMMDCFDEPEKVKTLISKCAEFITGYIRAFKQVGADGVILAEPAAGLLSPDMCGEFSTPFVKQIADAVNDDSFVFCYHNCGAGTVHMAESIASIGADIYHFGNAIELAEIIPLMPRSSLVIGNVDPVLFRNGTPEQVKAATKAVFESCKGYESFMLSTGCDVPAAAKWENIEAYFEAVDELYR